MVIPKKIQIMDSEIRIEWDEHLHFKDDSTGSANYRENKIVLQPSTKKWPVDDADMIHTLFHEITHWILHKMESELKSDEQFVEVFSGLMHQALVSGEFIHDKIEK